MKITSYLMLGLAVLALLIVFTQGGGTNLSAIDDGDSITLQSSNGNDVAITCASDPDSGGNVGFLCPSQFETLQDAHSIQGHDVSSGIDPEEGDSLVWDGDQFVVQTAELGFTDGTDNYTAGTLQLSAGENITINQSQDEETITYTIASTDARDATELQGNSLASAAPSEGQILLWNATDREWQPSNEVFPFYVSGETLERAREELELAAGDGMTIVLTSTDTRAKYTLSSDGKATHFGDVEIDTSGTPSDGQYYIYNSTDSQFELSDLLIPFVFSGATINSKALEIAAGNNIAVARTGDADQVVYTISADNVNANQLQGRDIADVAPTDGQVLKWDNAQSRWEPNTDVSTTGEDGTSTALVWEDDGQAFSGAVNTINLAGGSVAGQEVTVVGSLASGTLTYTFSINRPELDFQANGGAVHSAYEIDLIDGDGIDVTLDTATGVANYTIASTQDALRLNGVLIDTAVPTEGQYFAYDGTNSFDLVDLLFPFEVDGGASLSSAALELAASGNVEVERTGDANTVIYTFTAPDARDATEFQNVPIVGTTPNDNEIWFYNVTDNEWQLGDVNAVQIHGVTISDTALEEGQYYAYDGVDSLDPTNLLFTFVSGTEDNLSSASLEIAGGDGITVTRSGDSSQATYTIESNTDLPCRIKLSDVGEFTRLFSWQSAADDQSEVPWDSTTRASLEHTCEQKFRFVRFDDTNGDVAAAYAYIAQPMNNDDLMGFVVTVDEQELFYSDTLTNTNDDPPGTSTGEFIDVIPVASADSSYGASWSTITFTKMAGTTDIDSVTYEVWRSDSAFTLGDASIIVHSWR